MPKLDNNKLTGEQQTLLAKIKGDFTDEGADAASLRLKELILGLRPDLSYVKKKLEFKELGIPFGSTNVNFDTIEIPLEEEGIIPDRLATITEIVVQMHLRNGDQGYLIDRIHDMSMESSKMLDDMETFPSNSESKTYIVKHDDNLGNAVDCLIGPFDTRGDAENYAYSKDLNRVHYRDSVVPQCDEDGDWI